MAGHSIWTSLVDIFTMSSSGVCLGEVFASWENDQTVIEKIIVEAAKNFAM